MSSNKSYVREDILNKFTDNQSIRFNDRYFATWIEINEQLFNEIALFMNNDFQSERNSMYKF